MIKSLALVSGSALLAVLGIAPSASASVTPVASDCSVNPSGYIDLTGDTFEFTPAANCTNFTWSASQLLVNDIEVTLNGTPINLAYYPTTTPVPPGSTICFRYSGSNTSGQNLANVVMVNADPASSPSVFVVYQIQTTGTGTGSCSTQATTAGATAVNHGPGEVLQQVPRPATGCAAFDAPTLNWAGVAPGGWSDSWARWINNGNGGPVCTRTLTYSTSRDQWILAP